MPDLLCVNCGRRFEVKSKSNLAIKLSHSVTSGREWDADMRDDDMFVFLRVVLGINKTDHSAESALYFTKEALKRSEHSAMRSKLP